MCFSSGFCSEAVARIKKREREPVTERKLQRFSSNPRVVGHSYIGTKTPEHRDVLTQALKASIGVDTGVD